MSIQDEEVQIFAGAGRIGGPRNPLVEGTPRQIEAANRAAGIKLEVDRARHAGYREYSADDLEYVPRWKIWLDDAAGRILERVHVPESDRELICGFQVGTDGRPVYFRIAARSGLPSTPFLWRAQQNNIASKTRIAALERRAELITKPLLPVTLAELEGVPALPTLKAAADIILESGKLELVGDRLRVHLRVRGERELNATRVLYAAEPIVVSAIKAAGKNKDVVSLVDVEVLAGGGIA